MSDRNKLTDLVATNKEISGMALFRKTRTISKKQNESELEWFARRADHYKRLWLASYRYLTDEQKRMARQEVMHIENKEE